MATAALTTAAIGTVTGGGLPLAGGGLPLAGQAAGQLVAGARAGHGPDPRGYRPQATRGEDGQRIATPARAGGPDPRARQGFRRFADCRRFR